ncbi:LysM peptidoglycan-binding domain-containing protein [Microbacterium sp. JC 701]|uniref:LysM peptidoglycan-binding domain-containing protein n=1 Tax=Microbacterium sp. JC 701 TaxID=2897389 RepID=UPI001E47792A|nr:LysM domain-containing protein [Microbacterium sp. JC 701]MCD2168574.1 LysM peptidoglycan-binding domain-containing protein [Microbacterium sp. JC 701]
MGAQRTATTIGIGVLAVILTACTPPPGPLIDAVRPSASARATPETPSTPAPLVDARPCDAVAPVHAVADPADPEQLGGKTLEIPVDRGLLDTASGEAVLNAEGVPVAYRVAPGDVFSTIAARFCVAEDWLLIVNHARRDNNGLYAGDTLNLDAHTIFSVGDQNGVVSDNVFPPEFTLPPQR